FKSLAIIVAVLIGTLFFTTGQIAQAHLSGLILEEIVGQYSVDVSLSELTVFTDKKSRYEFELFDATEKTERIPFTDVWVRITKEGKSVFTSNIFNPELGRAGMTLALHEPGE